MGLIIQEKRIKLAECICMSSKTKTLDGKSPFVPNYLLAHICISNNSRVFIAGVAQLVEHHLAKVDVEGSNPFARSMNILSGH